MPKVRQTVPNATTVVFVSNSDPLKFMERIIKTEWRSLFSHPMSQQ